jgi:hypothetical protein
MRLLLELVIAAAIIALAWEKSLSERVSELPWFTHKVSKTESHSQSSTLDSRPAPSAPGAWMWDRNRKSVLDTPHPKATPR